MIEDLIELPFDVPLLPVKSLKAGEISCIYENGNLRKISFYGDVIVQMIYPAVRGKHWETASSEITDENINSYEKSFEITYTAFFRLNQIHYRSRITITGNEDNSITFAMFGEAISKFEAKRIGLCVLHPISACKGKRVTITRPDNTTYAGPFPDYVSPHQPFFDVQQMYWTNDQNHAIQLIFEGDVFETEDQRNWSDNSYKTYSTPLDRPSPVLVEEGAKLEQRVMLKILNDETALNKKARINNDEISNYVISNIEIRSDLEEEIIPFPKIGYSRIPGNRLLTNPEIAALKKVPFDHYRVELFMSDPHWQEELQASISEAEKLNTLLELIVFFSDKAENEVSQLEQQLNKYESRIASLLPLHIEHDVTPAFLSQLLYSRFKNLFLSIKIGYGTNASFAALNRNRPVSIDYDFVSFSLNPQVHATDTRTIIENLESQQQILESIRQFTTKPVHLSPITFQHRTETFADTRLQSYFGAAWTLITIRNFCKASSITFYQTTGEKGIIANPESKSKNVSKIYEVFMRINEFQPIFVIISRKTETVTFENSSGEKLIYLIESSH